MYKVIFKNNYESHIGSLHDYKADRERLEAEFDRRHPELANTRPPLTGTSKKLFDCFRSNDPMEQIRAVAKLGGGL